MAEAAGAGFIPIRKKGKLPGECGLTSYDLEYGSATVEIQKDKITKKGCKVAIVDDLLATGGTMKGAVRLLKDLGMDVEVVECFVIMELVFLEGGKGLGSKLESLIKY